MDVPVVKETLNVAGLLINVYSRSDLRRDLLRGDKPSSDLDSGEPPRPIVVLFFLHGRGQSADSDSIDTTARGAFAWAADRSRKEASSGESTSKQKQNLGVNLARDFMVVTFVSLGGVFLSSPLLFFTTRDRETDWIGS
jgi:hypothetical protein